MKYSCPEEIISVWIDDYSETVAEDILKCLSGRPSVFAKVNTLKVTRTELIKELKKDNVSAKKTELTSSSVELEFSGSLSNLNAFKNGYFHIQDMSSQICCEILDPQKGEIVSDVCSAPGGKAFNIAERMNGEGKVNCCDIHDHKLKLIENTAKRLGLKNINVKKRDALSDEPLEISDRILCDVPCSGLGILKRKPEIRY